VALNVTVPKWGMTMKEGRISKWFKSEGDTIEKGEPFFEVETEKITNVVKATASGIVFQIVVSAGTKVPVVRRAKLSRKPNLPPIARRQLRLKSRQKRNLSRPARPPVVWPRNWVLNWH
jgi:hypothetical protein